MSDRDPNSSGRLDEPGLKESGQGKMISGETTASLQ
jgi:hypothetical protein